MNWDGTQPVTDTRRKLRHHSKSFFIFRPIFLGSSASSSRVWPLLIRLQSPLWRFGTDIAVAYLLKGLLWILTAGRLHWSHRQEWTSRLLQRVPLWNRWDWIRLNKHETSATLSVKATFRVRDSAQFAYIPPAALLGSPVSSWILPGSWWKWMV